MKKSGRVLISQEESKRIINLQPDWISRRARRASYSLVRVSDKKKSLR